jgi:hypothetical protein
LSSVGRQFDSFAPGRLTLAGFVSQSLSSAFPRPCSDWVAAISDILFSEATIQSLAFSKDNPTAGASIYQGLFEIVRFSKKSVSHF